MNSAVDGNPQKPPLPIEVNQNLLYRPNHILPTFLYTLPDASPYFAGLLGMDFLPLTCPHKKVSPALNYATTQASVNLRYPKARWLSFHMAHFQRAGLGLYLAFEGPLGELHSLNKLFPDVVSPTPDLPYTPLHPFGQTLFREYYKAYLPSSRHPPLLFMQPAPPVAPLTRNDLETHKSFRRAMEKKYATIENANLAWDTNFEGFRYVDLMQIKPPPGPAALSAAAPNSHTHAMWSDWLDYQVLNQKEQAQAFTDLARACTGDHHPMITLSSSDSLAVEPVASGTETYLFKEPLVFSPPPGPVITLTSTYQMALAHSAGKPIIDAGQLSWPVQTPLWQEMAFLRHFLWRRLWHGASTVAFPIDAGEALLAVPRFTAEAEILRHFLAPDRQARNHIVFIHPTETLRPLPPQARAQALDYLIEWWQSLAICGFSVKVVSSEDLNADDLLRTRIIVCPLCLVLNEQSFSLLEQFAQEGGVVITDWGAFQQRDNTRRQRNNTRKLLGLRHIAPVDLKEATINLTTGEEIPLTPRPVDRTTGDSVEFVLAKSYGFRAGPAGKNPVTAVNRFGQGFVYSILLHLPERPLKRLLRRILRTHGLFPNIKVTVEGGQEAELVEANSMAHAGKTLLSVFNLGAKREFLVAQTVNSEKNFNITHPLTGDMVPSPGNKTYWTSEELRMGIKVFLERGEVAVMLIEPIDDIAKIPIRGISKTQHAMLSGLGGASHVGPLFLLSPAGKTPYAHPTARRILEKCGFRTGDLTSEGQFSAAAAAWINHDSPDSISAGAILSFVSAGGGLLLEAVAPPGEAPGSLVQDLLDILGLKLGTELTSSEHDLQNQALPLVLMDFTNHPITSGLNSMVLPYGRHLEAGPMESQVLVHGGESIKPAGASIVHVYEYGSGRILVMGGCWWADPLVLDLGDNAKLLARAARYVTHRNPMGFSETELQSSLFIRHDSLQAIHLDLQTGQTTLAPYPIMHLADPFPSPDKTSGPFWTTFSPSPPQPPKNTVYPQ